MYKKIIKWKKKPEWYSLIMGIVFILVGIVMLVVLARLDIGVEKIGEKGLVFLSIIFTCQIIFGVHLIRKYKGCNRMVYYKKQK